MFHIFIRLLTFSQKSNAKLEKNMIPHKN